MKVLVLVAVSSTCSILARGGNGKRAESKFCLKSGRAQKIHKCEEA